MDKQKLQDEELDSVSGGASGFFPDETYYCPVCEYETYLDRPYPDGFFTGIKTTCGVTNKYYECPRCGKRWYSFY